MREILGKRRPYVGSLYVEQYQDPQTFKRAVQMNIEKSGSLMVFDIVHIIQKNWWKPLKEAMKWIKKKQKRIKNLTKVIFESLFIV